MTLKNKKENLKYIALNGKYDYDTIVYKILKKDSLDQMIRKIDQVPVPCDVRPDDLTSSEEQFVQLLDRFVDWFQEDFPTLSFFCKFIIEEIIETNYNEMEQYLLSKHYLGDNKYIPFFQKSIYKIIINNFIANVKYIPVLEALIQTEGIKIKNYDSIKLDTIIKLERLLSDIVFCNGNNLLLHLLFSNIDYEIEAVKNKGIKNNNTEFDIKYEIQVLKDYYEFHYELMINIYLKKKEYLKIFKPF